VQHSVVGGEIRCGIVANRPAPSAAFTGNPTPAPGHGGSNGRSRFLQKLAPSQAKLLQTGLCSVVGVLANDKLHRAGAFPAVFVTSSAVQKYHRPTEPQGGGDWHASCD
jgi:hypothetical protein